MELRVAEIEVGARQRKELGDIDTLAASITDLGLMHPIVVNRQHRLIAGGRRLAAVKKLGWERIPATIIDTEEEDGEQPDAN